MSQKPSAPHFVSFYLCRCGKLHVTLGDVTLHFTSETFLAFASEIAGHADRLKQRLAGGGGSTRLIEVHLCH